MVSERSATDQDGNVLTADEWVADRRYHHHLSVYEFAAKLRLLFHISDYERMHSLMERRAQLYAPPKTWREGEDLDAPAP